MQAPARLLCTPPRRSHSRGRFCFVCWGVLRPHYKISPRLVVRRARPDAFLHIFCTFSPVLFWHTLALNTSQHSTRLTMYLFSHTIILFRVRGVGRPHSTPAGASHTISHHPRQKEAPRKPNGVAQMCVVCVRAFFRRFR